MYKHISVLKTNSEETFESLDAWLEFHGPVGAQNPLVLESELTLNEDGTSVTRVLFYETEADRETHREGFRPADKEMTYTGEFVSEETFELE